MGADGRSFGYEPKWGIVLPAPCIGHVLGRGVGSCANEGSITLLGLIEGDAGEPMPVIVTVCPSHARGARMYLESVGRGDEVTTWATSTFAENFEVVADAGIEPWVLTRLAG